MNLPGPEKVSGKQLVPLWKRESTFLPRPDHLSIPFFLYTRLRKFPRRFEQRLVEKKFIKRGRIIRSSLVGASYHIESNLLIRPPARRDFARRLT